MNKHEAIEKITEVPTGHILIIKGEKGLIETVSMGDYGKDINLNKDIRVDNHYPLLPLTDKWVATISTQYGCSMGCQFCDVPKVGPGRNCSLKDMQTQVLAAMSLWPEVLYSNRFNVHYARMGDPSFNPAVIEHALWMKRELDKNYNVHPVLTTMLPRKNKLLPDMLNKWMQVKNEVYNGNAGLQLSINSTCNAERERIFTGSSITLEEAGKLSKDLKPRGRKIVLNFPVCGWEIDANKLIKLFNPDIFIIKLTPMHITQASSEHGHKTEGDYASPEPYKLIERNLREVGYEVLVFIASEDEDNGMITCGNALLSNSKKPKTRSGSINFIGDSPIGKTPYTPWLKQPDPFHEQLTEKNIYE